MRKIVTLVCMMLIGASCYADEDSETNKKIDQLCKSISSSAAMVMKARQANLPMSEQLEIISEADSEYFKTVMRNIVMEAYDYPRLNTPSYQTQAIQDFENKVMLECLRKHSI